MPCDTKLKPKQTISQRAEEIRRMIGTLSSKLASGLVKVLVSKEGGIVFDGLTNEERDGVTDACAYRRLMVSGSALAKAKVTAAEQLAGRAVDRRAMAHGLHSHDGGKTWHHGH